jgi:hypothetical protein
MPVDTDVEKLIAALAEAVISHADELTALDRAITALKLRGKSERGQNGWGAPSAAGRHGPAPD